MFEVVLSRSAATFFQRLDRAWQERVRAALESLREDPFGHSKALADGTRVGALRIIFTVDTQPKLLP
jgi:mRNA-degrading endonuclease RelE of RelBE toxin-antitoxin system